MLTQYFVLNAESVDFLEIPSTIDLYRKPINYYV